MAATFEEHDTVVLVRDDREHDLRAGDVGVIVAVYERHDAYDIEFTRADGRPVAILTLPPSEIRPLGEHDLLHVRQVSGVPRGSNA